MIKTRLLGATAALLLSAGAAAAAPAMARQDLNVRSGPGTQFGKVGVIQSGETVDVTNCTGSWCQVAFSGGTGFANRSYLQMAGGVPSAGVVVQAPAYSPYYDDDYFDSGYSYSPGFSFYAGPGFRHRHPGWRHGWRGGRDGWQGRPGGWAGRPGNWQGRPGGDAGPRVGAGIGRGAPQPSSIDSAAGRVSAPVGMPSGGARGGGPAAAPSAAAPPAAAPGGGGGGGGRPAGGGVRDSGR